MNLYAHLRAFPVMALKLLYTLNDDDSAIRNVYDCLCELVKLCMLRAESSQALQMLRSVAPTPAIPRIFVEEIEEDLYEWFTVLEHVSDGIKQQIWQNVRDAIVLGVEEPTTLQQTISVIEAEDSIDGSQYGQLKLLDSLHMARTATKIAKLKREFNSTAQELLTKLMFSEIEQSIAERFDEMGMRSLDEHDNDSNDNPPSPSTNRRPLHGLVIHAVDHNKKVVAPLLEDMKELVEDLMLVKNHVEPCFPAKFQIFKFFFSRYHQRLINNLATDFLAADLSLFDLMECCQWLQWYSGEVAQWSHKDEITMELNVYIDKFMDHYVTEQNKNILPFIDSLLLKEQTALPEKDDDEYPVTPGPQLLFTTLNQLIDATIDAYALSGQSLIRISQFCQSIVEYYLNGLTSYLIDVSSYVDPSAQPLYHTRKPLSKHDKAAEHGQTNAATKESKLFNPVLYYISQINNTDLYEQYSIKVHDALIDNLSAEKNIATINSLFEELYKKYNNLAELCVDILVQHTLKRVHPFLQQLFTPAWLDKSGFLSDPIVALFEEIIPACSKGISQQKYFEELVKMVVHHLTMQYAGKIICQSDSDNK